MPNLGGSSYPILVEAMILSLAAPTVTNQHHGSSYVGQLASSRQNLFFVSRKSKVGGNDPGRTYITYLGSILHTFICLTLSSDPIRVLDPGFTLVRGQQSILHTGLPYCPVQKKVYRLSLGRPLT